ncbi:MAG: BsuBI/PstI family type II restriction endonuclease [Acinetobacter sp.]
MSESHQYISDAISILKQLGFPPKQQQERSALTLLALLDLQPDGKWQDLKAPLMGVTPIMDWMNLNYQKQYAPNSRETVRRQTLHQFVSAGLILYNPDEPNRPVNSGKTVYQIEPNAKVLLQNFGTDQWESNIEKYLADRDTLVSKYAKEREHLLVPVQIDSNTEILLTPGSHSELIKKIIENFAPRFAPNSTLIYAGDTGSKVGHFNETLLAELGVTINKHGKMPDVVLYFSEKDWLILIESVTSHGPVDGKRHEELAQLFANSSAGLVYVTAFPDRAIMRKYLGDIAWETEVWVADAPTHLIHFNGVRFLGPY